MQDRDAELAFYNLRFGRNPRTEHISGGYEELHALALGELAPTDILDLGCGTGAHAVRLAQRGHDVIAVDMSLIAVTAARARFVESGVDGLFVVADGVALPFRDGAVGCTWASLVVHHFPDIGPIVAEIVRVSRTRIVTVDPNGANWLSWIAFNVVNRFISIRGITPNQRAIDAGALADRFASLGYRRTVLHYVDRQWSDRFALVRRLYHLAFAHGGPRRTANQFLAVFERT